MMLSLQLFALFIACCSVLTVNGQFFHGGNFSGFTGPGHIACDASEYKQSPCVYGEYSVCTEADYAVCESKYINGADIVRVSADGQRLYIDLCCAEVYNCPYSCTKSNEDIPTLDPVVYNANFTGPGVVECLMMDGLVAPRSCEPYISDGSSCGTCNATAIITEGDYSYLNPFTTILLPCSCLTMTNCPNSCTFNGTVTGPTVTNTPDPGRSFTNLTSANANDISSAHDESRRYCMTLLGIMATIMLSSLALF